MKLFENLHESFHFCADGLFFYNLTKDKRTRVHGQLLATGNSIQCCFGIEIKVGRWYQMKVLPNPHTPLWNQPPLYSTLPSFTWGILELFDGWRRSCHLEWGWRTKRNKRINQTKYCLNWIKKKVLSFLPRSGSVLERRNWRFIY